MVHFLLNITHLPSHKKRQSVCSEWFGKQLEKSVQKSKFQFNNFSLNLEDKRIVTNF